MKRIYLILTFMLAWIGVSNVQADLTTDHYTANFSLSGTKATALTANAYYILQNRATGQYLIDNNGVLETTSVAPVTGDTQDKDVNCKEYLFQATTATGGFNINGIYGTSLPTLKANMVTEDTVDVQLVKPARYAKAANSAVYTVGQLGAVEGYLRLVNNDLYLNSELKGAQSKDSYTAWTLIPVTLSQMIYIPVTCKCGTETIQSGSIWVPVTNKYGGPRFTDYTLDQDSVAVTASTSSLTLQYTQTAYTVTYIYKSSNGSTWYTEQHPGLVAGSKYPAATLAPGVSGVTGIPTGTVSKSKTITLTCSTVFGFELYDSYDAIQKWYTMRITGGKTYINYDSSKEYIPLSSTISTDVENAEYGFIGNPYTGIQIVNKAAGSTKILSSTNPATTGGTGQNSRPHFIESTAVTSAMNTSWDIISSTNNGDAYYIARHGGNIYWNSRADHGISGESSSVLAYWTSTGAGSNVWIEYYDPNVGASTTMTASPSTTATVAAGKVYRIYNKGYAGYLIYDNGKALYSTTTKTEKELNQYWLVQTSGSNYTFRNLRTGNYIQAAESGYVPTGSTKQGFAIVLDEDQSAYGIGIDLTNRSCIHMAASHTPCKWDWSDNFTQSEWVFEEVGDVANEYTYDELYSIAKSFDGFAESITSGKYYRLYNYSYNERLLTENYKETTSSVSGISAANAKAEGSQIWKLTKNANGQVSFQNVMTGKNILDQGSTSAFFYTGTGTGKAFYTASGTTDNFTAPYFTFSRTNGGSGLHCASSQGYHVVLWTSSADANRWYLKEVTLTADEIAAIQQVYTDYNQGLTDYSDAVNNTSKYNNTLQTIFDDYACTQMKSTYKNMTDAELRAATTTLPTEIQDMAIAVKNDTWNTAQDETYNTYEKNFRIAPYEVYTNCNWNAITNVGQWAMLYNPTGITVEEDQILQVYISADAAADDAEILLHVVSDTNRYPDQTVTLKKGLNYVYCTANGEVFIDYTLNNAPSGTWNGHTVNDYPNITGHIEGGTCSGMWDMHRGMTNADWAWLTANMFTNDRLHVKSHSTLLNLITESVRSADRPVEVMKAWDFIFDTQEKLMGCGKWIKSGAYKPIINSRTSYSGNPNWDGGHGCNHPGITSSYMFGVDGLYNNGEHGGTMWEIAHEEGHGHQYPILLAGTTEMTNNSLANCVNFLWNMHKDEILRPESGEWIRRSSRQDGVKGLTERYNKGYSWMDFAGQRDCGDGYSSLWIGNKWFFQLWLYFDYMGNYQPEGGNDGFSFVSELCDKLRANPIVKRGGSWGKSNPPQATDDWLKIAQYASEICQADMSEYFEVWGFFREKTYNENSNDDRDNNIFWLGDYGDYYVQSSATAAATVKANMQKYDKKCSNLIFLEDRGSTEDTWLTYNSSSGTTSTSFGETGWYKTFMDGVQMPGYTYVLNGTTVTMSGEGAVGYKIYDADGNLVWVSNMNSFTVSSEVATNLQNGTYTLKIAQGDGTDFALGEYNEITIGNVCKRIQKMLGGNTAITPTIIRQMINEVVTKE